MRFVDHCFLFFLHFKQHPNFYEIGVIEEKSLFFLYLVQMSTFEQRKVFVLSLSCANEYNSN